jgi:hypothetical protein
MKNNRLLLLLFLLLALATGAYFYFGKGQSGQSTINTWDRQFKLSDPSSLHKVFIADRMGNRTTLTRNGDHWLYNGEHRVNENVMKNLLQVIQHVDILYIPPAAAVPPAVAHLASNGVKVELYDKNDGLLKAYYVGNTTADGRGTFFIMENANQPYVMHIPGLEGDLSIRYTPRGDQWRDKTVFRERPEEISYVSVEYPTKRNLSFILEKQGNDFSVSPFHETTRSSTKPLQRGRVEAYLTGFERIMAEAYQNDLSYRDSILQQIPFSVITLRKTDGTEKVVSLFPLDSRDAYGQLKTEEIERYFLDVNQQDFMLMQHRIIGKLLWAYEYFFEPPLPG